jgi:hypothetical protein
MERDKLVMERDKLVTERNKLVMERGELVTERNKLVAQRGETNATRIGAARRRVLSDGGAGPFRAGVLPGVAGSRPFSRSPIRVFLIKSVYSAADVCSVAADESDESDSTGRENFSPPSSSGP